MIGRLKVSNDLRNRLFIQFKQKSGSNKIFQVSIMLLNQQQHFQSKRLTISSQIISTTYYFSHASRTRSSSKKIHQTSASCVTILIF